MNDDSIRTWERPHDQNAEEQTENLLRTTPARGTEKNEVGQKKKKEKKKKHKKDSKKHSKKHKKHRHYSDEEEEEISEATLSPSHAAAFCAAPEPPPTSSKAPQSSSSSLSPPLPLPPSETALPPPKANRATKALPPADFSAMCTPPPRRSRRAFSGKEVRWLRRLFAPSGVGVVVRRRGGVEFGASPRAEEDDSDVAPDAPSIMVLLHPDCIQRFARYGSIGVGEAYMEEQWVPEPNTPDGLKRVLFQMSLFYEDLEKRSKTWASARMWAKSYISNRAVRKSKQLHSLHYDLGNDLYLNMLDKTFMQYTCSFWRKDTRTLEEAQENKLCLLAQKLNLTEPGLRVLDIGCGFGGLAKFLASRFDAVVVGITLSKEQAAFAQETMPHPNVEYRVQDYRHIPRTKERFDRVVSVGMFEHVGPKNYRTFFDNTSAILKSGGHMVLHFIGNNGTAYKGREDAWIDKYIFPGAILPTLNEFTRLCRKYFYVDDLHCIGPSYAKTLRAWHRNFHAALDRGDLGGQYADPTFVRMWDYYLIVCEALFECRAIALWQFVLIPRVPCVPDGSQHVAEQSDFARVLPPCVFDKDRRPPTLDGMKQREEASHEASEGV